MALLYECKFDPIKWINSTLVYTDGINFYLLIRDPGTMSWRTTPQSYSNLSYLTSNFFPPTSCFVHNMKALKNSYWQSACYERIIVGLGHARRILIITRFIVAGHFNLVENERWPAKTPGSVGLVCEEWSFWLPFSLVLSFGQAKEMNKTFITNLKDNVCFPFFSYHKKKGTKKNHRMKSFSTIPVDW